MLGLVAFELLMRLRGSHSRTSRLLLCLVCHGVTNSGSLQVATMHSGRAGQTGVPQAKHSHTVIPGLTQTSSLLHCHRVHPREGVYLTVCRSEACWGEAERLCTADCEGRGITISSRAA